MPDRLPNGADEFNLPEPHVIPTQKAPPHGRFLILTFPCSAIRIRFHSGMPCKFILTYLAKRLIPHTPPCRKSQNENGVDSPQSGGESEIRTRERLAPSTVFKTVAINRSAISPIIFQHTLRNSVPTTVCGSTAAPTRLARRSPLHSDAKTVAINRSAISPIIFQHTLRNSVPTTVCGSTAAPTRLARRSPLHSDAKTVAINRFLSKQPGLF